MWTSLPLPRPRGGRGHRSARRGSSSTSRAATACASGAYEEWYGFVHRCRRARSGATRCRSSCRPRGRLIANPGCYATAALLALRRSRTRSIRRASSSTRSPASPGAGRALKASRTPATCSRTSRRTRSARHQHAPRSSRRSASRSASSRTCCPSSVACSPPATCGARGDLRARLEAAYATATRSSCFPRASRRSSRASGNGRGRDRALRGPGDGPHDRHLRARQPRQGRRRPGGAEREPRARLPETGPAAAGGAGVSVTAAEGLRRERRPLRDPQGGARPRDRPLVTPAVGAAMFTANRCSRRRSLVSQEHSRGRAAGGRRQLRHRERRDRRARASRRARDRAEAARLLDSPRAGARALDRRDRRAAAARPGARRPRAAAAALSTTAATTRPGRS